MTTQRDIWTIGHSNRTAEDFLALLVGESIELLVDVRRFPGSRKHPQFNVEALQAELSAAKIDYRHLPGLGGRRSRNKNGSPNTAWRVESFNAYADHMQSPEFIEAFDELTNVASERSTCIMCAEALPWRCHRRLISDLLVVRGWAVHNIMGGGKPREHTLTEFAHLEGDTVTYPGGTLFD